MNTADARTAFNHEIFFFEHGCGRDAVTLAWERMDEMNGECFLIVRDDLEVIDPVQCRRRQIPNRLTPTFVVAAKLRAHCFLIQGGKIPRLAAADWRG